MSGWLWASPDPAKAEAAHAKALQELREKLQCDAGRKAAQQLVQGGELKHPDEMTQDRYLKKWLVAREWHVPVTYSCIISHAAWRAHTMPNGYTDEAWIQQPLADEKTYLQGVDVQGRAFSVIKVRKHIAKRSKPQAMKLFTCYVMNAKMVLCDPVLNPGQRLISLYDMTNCSLANLDVASLRMILGLLSQHYVEQLAVMYFYNPPLVAWGLWSSLKGLLPEATRNKIKFIDPSDLSELKAAVPADVLPVEYGGSAELVLINDAIRQHKLPPYPHLPDVAGTAGGEAPIDVEAEGAAGIAVAADAAAEIEDGQRDGKLEASTAGVAVEVDAAVS